MDAFHGRLARIGLAATRRYGFALAGGYAVQAAGLFERPSEDVDLFTAWDRRDDFSTAVTAVVDAYRDDGLTVDVERQYETFVRLTVAGGDRASKMELGVDWRANEPILMAIGPVLHPDDAVANKMSALYGRAFARDFIDIDATLRSAATPRTISSTSCTTPTAGSTEASSPTRSDKPTCSIPTTLPSMASPARL